VSAESDMNGDLREAIRMLAADNVRLLGIVEAADKLAEAIKNHGERHFAVRDALDAFRIIRQGH
jgi:hypothetical protein